jgi:hypothetical protein
VLFRLIKASESSLKYWLIAACILGGILSAVPGDLWKICNTTSFVWFVGFYRAVLASQPQPFFGKTKSESWISGIFLVATFILATIYIAILFLARHSFAIQKLTYEIIRGLGDGKQGAVSR